MTNSSPYASVSDFGHQSLPPELETEVTVLQIITVAAMAGPIVFMGVVLAANNGELGTTPDFLAWIAMGVTAMDLGLFVILPNGVANHQLDRIRLSESKTLPEANLLARLVGVYRVRHFMSLALLEGAIFINAIAYFVSRFAGNLAAAFALLVILALKLPSVQRVVAWSKDVRTQFELN